MNTIDTKSAKLGDELIDKHIKKMFGSLEMASIDYFKETGRISGSFYVRLRDMIEEAAASQSLPKEEDKWIRVEDRLPENGDGRYWCYLEEVNDLGISHYQWNCPYNENDKQWGGTDGAKVTHWQPLPSPPIKPIS